MKILIIVLLGMLSTYNPQCLKMDIVLVMDISGSVEGKEQFVIDAIDTFVNRFELSEEGIKIATVFFSDEAAVTSKLTTNKQQLLDSYKRVIPGGLTNLTGGLYAAGNEILERGRPGAIKLIIVVSDGGNNVGDAKQTSSEIKNMIGANICSVMVQTMDSREDIMRYICSNDCYSTSSYEGLVNQLKKIQICL